MAENFDLLNALMQKLAIVVMGPDSANNLKVPESHFISFCTPGIAVDPADFDFGFVAPEANKTSAAADFSALANTIPPTQGRWMASDSKLDDFYAMILRDSVFPTVKLTEQEKKSLQASRDLLIRDVQTIDPATGGMVTRPADTPLFEVYKERESIYLNAAADYRSLQVNYLYNGDARSATEWALKGPILERKVRATYNSWLPVKSQVEKALGIIDTIGARGPEIYWSGLKQRFERSKFATPEGDQYFLTKYFPGKFWDDGHKTGWLKFTFGHNEVHQINESSSMNVGGGGSVSYGLWSFGASASYAEQREFFKADITNTALQVSLTVVPIRRSWLDGSVLKSRGWDFDPNINQTVLSDGGSPPKGAMPAYATAMILARDLKLSTDLSSEQNEHVATQMSASGSVGWGPFSVRGNYSRNTDRRTHDFVKNGAGLEAAGMQIIGFMCEYVGKLPNRDPKLNWGE